MVIVKRRDLVFVGQSGNSIVNGAFAQIINANQKIWSGAAKVELHSVTLESFFVDVTNSLNYASDCDALITFLDGAGAAIAAPEIVPLVSADLGSVSGLQAGSFGATATSWAYVDTKKIWQYGIDISTAMQMQINFTFQVPVGLVLPATWRNSFRLKMDFDIYLNR